ncbi:MAG TPA: Ig-like domain-containing protein [Sedimentisphaerales bacterium]|nr:Ig-like domain-containing protein [Sedimentisphaerales bacterium]
MKLLKRIRRNHCFRGTVVYLLTCCMVFFNMPLSVARAAPQGGAFVPGYGSGTIVDGVQHSTVEVTSQRSIINWSSFDTLGGSNPAVRESLTFSQSGVTSAAVLNKVSGPETQFNGDLNGAGMRIFVVNPAGVIFGEGASVNVAQLVASALHVTNEDFAAGRYEFSALADSLGDVANYGEINASEGVALIARNVLNAGTIVTGADGFMVMAAGDRVLLKKPESNILVDFEMDSVTEGAGAVTNDGAITSPAGKVVLASGDIYSTALKAFGGSGAVQQNGAINADGTDGDGGAVTLTGADAVTLGTGSMTTASAGTVGDGGEIIAYSPGAALFEEGAKVEAKGGSISGQGGLFEISGHEDLALAGEIDLTGSDGLNGTFIIDPLNLEIVPGDVSTDTQLGIDKLEEFLGSANVMLRTEGTAGPDDGDIIFNADRYLNSGVDQFNKVTDNSLFVYAAEDIRFMAGNGIEFSGNGDVELYAGPEGSVTSVDRGKIPNIWTRAGDIIIEAGSGGIDLGSLQAGVETTAGDGGGDTVFNLRPGELRLATTEGGDITLQHLNVEGQRYGSVYVNSSGNLTINGESSFGGAVQVRTNTTSEDGDSASFICLIAEKDVTITGDVLAYAKGTKESVAGVWIGAGTQTQEGGTPGTVTLNDKVTADASASGAVTSDATIRIYGSTIVWPTNVSKYPQAKTQGSVSYSGIISDYRESSDPAPVYYQVDEYGRVIKDENGDPVIVENPIPLLEKKLGIGYRAAIEIDTAKDGTCLECVNKIRLVLPIAFDDIWTDSKNVAEITITVLVDGTTHGEVGDQDGLGNPLDGGTVLLADNPTTKGTLTLINGDTEVAYVPPADWVFDENGEFTDYFRYYAVDSDGDVSENYATVTITLINQIPTATGGYATTPKAVEVDIDNGLATFTLGSDGDSDGIWIEDITVVDPLYADKFEPIYGDVEVFGVGTVSKIIGYTYKADAGDVAGTTFDPDGLAAAFDSFTYKVTDGLNTSTASATGTINLTNQLPVAIGGYATTPKAVEVDIDNGLATFTLGSDGDSDGIWIEDITVVDPLYADKFEPIYGDVDVFGVGTVSKIIGYTYKADAGEVAANGTFDADGLAAAFDSFTYKVTDGLNTSTASATGTINLKNLFPVGVGADILESKNVDPIIVEGGATPTYQFIIGTDPDGDAVSIVPGSITSTTGLITGEIKEGGKVIGFNYTPELTNVSFDPASGETTGYAQISYEVTDGYNVSKEGYEGTVNIDLSNLLPVAYPDNYSVDEGQTLTIPFGDFLDVLSNDIDADGDLLKAILVNGGRTANGGTITLNSDGSFTYTPPLGFAGDDDSFEYIATDGFNVSSTRVAITVNATPPPPPPPPTPTPEIPPAPLPEMIVWEVGGCPALMEWLADELGVEPENVQFYGLHPYSNTENVVASQTSITDKGDIQWCLACSKLKNSAQILDDPDGTGPATVAQVIRPLMPPDGTPPSPEQMDAIAVALKAAAEDAQYASATEFVDAVVTYVTTLTDELGWDTADAVRLFMEKHGARLTQDESVNLYIGVLLSNIRANLAASGG